MTRRHRIADWDPEDAAAWQGGNKVIARRNLIWSVLTMHVAFSIWYLWSVMVLFMPQSVYHGVLSRRRGPDLGAVRAAAACGCLGTPDAEQWSETCGRLRRKSRAADKR